MKDYYTLKEILLGLKNDQMKVTDQLESLKKSLVKTESTERSFFSVLPLENVIVYYYRFKDKFSNWDSISFELKKTIEGDFCNFYLPIQKGKQLEFNQICENVLADEFVNNSSSEIKTNHGLLKIHPTCLHYFIDNPKALKLCNFSYFAKDNLIYLKGTNFFNDKKELINMLLNFQFKKEDFSKYIQNIIDTSEETNKDILLSDGKLFGKDMHFYLNQNPENYVLVKKKK